MASKSFEVGQRVKAAYYPDRSDAIRGTVEALSYFQSRHPDIPLRESDRRYKVKYDEPRGEFRIEFGFFNADDLEDFPHSRREADYLYYVLIPYTSTHDRPPRWRRRNH